MGNICLKEIVSNTRLDLQTSSDYFSDFPANVLIVRLLLGLFFFTVLIPNNLKSNTFLIFPFLHKSCKQNVLLCFCTVKPFFSVAIFFCLQKKHFVYVIFFISVRFFIDISMFLLTSVPFWTTALVTGFVCFKY